MDNLFADLPAQLPEELFEVLVHSVAARLERIIFPRPREPTGHWYDQDTNEWVLLLRGAAILRDR